MSTIAEMFIKEAIKTENLDLNSLARRLGEEKTIRLLHAAMGMVTEAGEFMDALKKYIIYGKPLDEVNLKEELGDLNWYEAIAHNTLNSSFEEVMIMNTKKLRKRYANKFSENEAINRDLNIEREALSNLEIK